MLKSVIQKNKILLPVFIIGILLIILGVIFFLKFNLKDDNKNDNSNKENNIQTEISKINNFEITNFQVKKNTPNKVDMVFKLINSGKEDINGKFLNINMYQKEKLLYTYGYEIQDLKISEYIYIQANSEFKYDKITKFEFVIDSDKVVIEPSYVD